MKSTVLLLQFILGAGALILAAIFALTSFTDLGGGPQRSQNTQQVRICSVPLEKYISRKQVMQQQSIARVILEAQHFDHAVWLNQDRCIWNRVLFVK